MNSLKEKINVEAITKNCRILDVKELLQLLKHDVRIFWSWGSHAYRVDNTPITKMFRMQVSGHHHKGHVYIFVNGLDLFDVYLTSIKGIIKDKIEGLYFDQLVEWIDEKIERVAAYTS